MPRKRKHKVRRKLCAFERNDHKALASIPEFKITLRREKGWSLSYEEMDENMAAIRSLLAR